MKGRAFSLENISRKEPKTQLCIPLSPVFTRDCGEGLNFIDEPTSGLDFDSMCHVTKLIQKLADLGKIIFIVTHDYEFVCRTCTRILYFSDQTLTEDITVCPENEQCLKTLFLV